MKTFWKAAGIRAVKTVAQTAVAMLPVAAAIQAVDWLTVLSTSLLAGIASLLTSLAGIPEVKTPATPEPVIEPTQAPVEASECCDDPARFDCTTCPLKENGDEPTK